MQKQKCGPKPKIEKIRFKEKYTVNNKTNCWEWHTKSKDKNGYGLFDRKDKSGKWKKNRAHRVAYEFQFGKFQQNLKVLHTCDNTCCVNPDHLFLGTHQDNMTDMHRKARGFHKFSKQQILNIRKCTDYHNIIAKKYNCSRQLIGQIKRKRMYKWAQ